MQERRVYPRFDVIFPARIEREGQAVLEATIFDVSQGGMQLGCDRQTAISLLPDNNQQVSRGDGIKARVYFSCPGGREAVEVLCLFVVCRRVSDNEYRFGMEFVEFVSQQDEEKFLNYINRRQEEVAEI